MGLLCASMVECVCVWGGGGGIIVTNVCAARYILLSGCSLSVFDVKTANIQVLADLLDYCQGKVGILNQSNNKKTYENRSMVLLNRPIKQREGEYLI